MPEGPTRPHKLAKSAQHVPHVLGLLMALWGRRMAGDGGSVAPLLLAADCDGRLALEFFTGLWKNHPYKMLQV